MRVAKNGTRVGAAAVLLGLSLAGPSGVAAADSTDDASPSTARERVKVATAVPSEDRTRRAPAAARPHRPSARNTTAAASEAPRVRTVTVHPAARRRASLMTAPIAVEVPLAATTRVARAVAAVIPAAPAVTALSAPVSAGAAAAATNWFTNLFAPVQALFEGVALMIRRTFFNAAPRVSPVQTSGQVSGLITGTIGAVDPEGDPIVYAVTQTPANGTVQIAADGTYTYTPGAGFTGRDTFIVSATDTGSHLNLLDLFRPAGTTAFIQVAQNATQPMLTFTFVYGSGSQFWGQAARAALQTTADLLATYLVVNSPVTITYSVTASSSALQSTLASAGSDLISTDPGFYDTVVQHKILTGIDSNGEDPDGEIDWNFGRSWAYGNTVGGGQYDFTSTAMHELMHTFGFLSNVDEPGWNATNLNWTAFDAYVVNANGANVIGLDGSWDPTYNTNLTGGNDGLYFGGSHAVAAYGGPVPLYTPSRWASGSSVSHLDDSTFTGRSTQLMNAVSNTGRGVRALSPIELAILQDLGYAVAAD